MTEMDVIRQNQRECQALRQADVFPDGPRAGQPLTDADREGATRGMEDWVGGGARAHAGAHGMTYGSVLEVDR